ncbi:MAG: zinc-ribbon domain-containing protein [Actinomycetota bacterium]
MGEHKCPECNAPIDDVRVTCPNCGYQYDRSDYEDTEAGNEFQAGSALDEQGEEMVDHPSGN